MKSLILSSVLTGFLLIQVVCTANSPVALSRNAHISLLTCDPGQQLYSSFGHSAFRVYDPINKINKVYNYGTFDFDAPNFYLNFVKGHLNYMLSTINYNYFEEEYVSENRAIYEQVFNLDSSDNQLLYEYLEQNALPENKYYLYDFLYNNCSTKIRDVLQAVFGDRIILNTEVNSRSFRQMIQPYLKDQPWTDFGIMLVFGLPPDKIASGSEAMFLPTELMNAMKNVEIETNISKQKLVSQTVCIFQSTQIEIVTPFWQHPFFVFSIISLLCLLLSVIQLIYKRQFIAIDIVLFAFAGLLGVLFVFLWTVTAHHSTAANMNLLWASPFHLVAVLLLRRLKQNIILRYYFLFYSVIIAIVCATWYVLPQELPTAMLPFSIVLSIRAALLFHQNAE